MKNRAPQAQEVAGFGNVLVFCSVVSVSVCLIGIVLFAISASSNVDATLPLRDALLGLTSLSALSVITFGILVLLVSPLIWVIVAFIGFATKKSFLYSFLSFLVLFFMLLSIAVSLK